jgi:hypothetical protein
MVYTAYESVIKFIQVLDVSSVETIEIEYVDVDMEVVKGIYSLTFSGRKYIGDEIRWDEEGCDKFKIYNNGINIDNDSDTEEEEEEDEGNTKDYMSCCVNLHLNGQFGCDLCGDVLVADKDNTEMLRDWLDKNNKYSYKLHRRWIDNKKQEEEEDE